MALPTSGRTGNFRPETTALFSTAGNPPSGAAVEATSVAQWTDLDGLSNFYAAGTARPTCRATTGISPGTNLVKTALGFDGSTDVMRLTGLGANYATDVAASTVLSTTGFSFFIVYSPAANPAAEREILGDVDGRISLRTTTTNTFFVRIKDALDVTRDSTAVALPASINVAKAFVLGVTFDGTTTQLYVNSTDPSYSGNLGVPGALTSALLLTCGSSRVGQVVFYNRHLSGTDIADAMVYLMSEYAYAIDVGNTEGKRVIYMLPSATGRKKWIGYIPVKRVGTAEAKDIGSTNENGCWYVHYISSVTGLKEWIDYTPCFLVSSPAAGKWRYDDLGWIPVSDI